MKEDILQVLTTVFVVALSGFMSALAFAILGFLSKLAWIALQLGWNAI